MHESIINLHIHTPYSDGHGSHQEIVQAALDTNIDVLIVTDHNVLVKDLEGVYQDGQKKVLLLVGEEVHDQGRHPQKSHLLVFGLSTGVSPLAPNIQTLLDTVQQQNGLSFLAHPHDPAAPAIRQDDLSWVDWHVQGYTGIELWNALSEFKVRIKSKLHALYYAFNPHRVARGPLPETLAKWDELLAGGKQVVAIGGSDAHAIPASLGPLNRTIFPYSFHFRGVNTHILTKDPLIGEYEADKHQVLQALRRGHAFIGYDLPVSTRGFRFNAQGKDGLCWMGDEMTAERGVTLQIRLPLRTECRLIKDGEVIRIWTERENCTHITTETGVYRVEIYIRYANRRRGWIFSNPIYIR